MFFLRLLLIGILIGFGMLTASAQDITTGLLARYAFENNYNDLSGQNRTATTTNVTFVAGPPGLGSAASFDDMSSAITSTGGALPGGNTSRSVAFWMYRTSAGNGNMVAWGRRSGNQRFSALVESNTALRVIGEGNDYTSAYMIPLNSWAHIVITHDGSQLRFYANGALVGTPVTASAFNTLATNPLRIGVNASPSNDEYFGGRLDEVRVYNRVLTAADVTALYNYVNGVCGTAASVATPTAPSTNLCAAGTASAVTANANGLTFDWACAGQSGDSFPSCSAPRQYTITATAAPAAGGSITCNSGASTYTGGATVSCTATANTGYNFTNFTGDCAGTTCTLNNAVGNKTITASFTLNSYAITTTASPVAGGTVSCTPNQVNHGTASSCTATPTVGYTFSGWSGDCTGTGICSLSNVTAAKTVTASFTLNSYAITTTASPVAGGTVSCTPNPVNHGATANCSTNLTLGYTFGGFSGDCTGANCTLSNVTGTRNITALFTLNNYAITAAISPAGAGTVTCTPNPVNYGASSSCTAISAAGYSFSSWSGDCTGTGGCSFSNVTAAKTVTASFSQNSYTVSASGGAGGSINPANQTVTHGGTTTFTVTPNTGYTAAVTGCGGTLSGSTYTTGVITGACTVTASFSQAPPNTHTITIKDNPTADNPAAGGSISCSPNPVPTGGSTTCTATPKPGYTFNGWSGACTGTGPCTLTNVTGDISLTPIFTKAAQKTYTGPIATSTGNATASVSGGGDTCGFSDARFVSLNSVATAPPVGYQFPQGLFKFTLSQCTVGSTVTVSIRYPAALPEGASYWKYGPTPNQAERWYPLSQASINGDTVTFNLTDGGLGDNDLKADGTISDPSGPVVPATDIPTLSEWAMLILLTLLLGVGGWMRRQRQAF